MWACPYTPVNYPYYKQQQAARRGDVWLLLLTNGTGELAET